MIDHIGILDAFGVRDGLAVNVHLLVDDGEFVSRQSNTAFHIVLAFIDRPRDDVILFPDGIAAFARIIVAGILLLQLHYGLGSIAEIEILLFGLRGVGVEHRLKLAHDGIVALRLALQCDRVAVGIVEDDHIVMPDGAKLFGAKIGQLDNFSVGLSVVGQGQFVVHKRHRYWRLRGAHPVGQLADRQEIAHHQGALH